MAELVPVSVPAPVPMTFRERLAQFKILEEKRLELIEVGTSVGSTWRMRLCRSVSDHLLVPLGVTR
jgi:hypothetical protein